MPIPSRWRRCWARRSRSPWRWRARLKYEGVFTLQTKGDGPVRMMVADVTTAGAVRGYAQVDDGAARARDGFGAACRDRCRGSWARAISPSPSIRASIPSAIRASSNWWARRSADCVHHYFRQSEQVEAGLKVAVARVPDANGVPRWRAGSLMIERLPPEDRARARSRGRGLAHAP